MFKIAFLVSGNGTNMENLVKEIQAGRIPDAKAAVVISDKPEAGALARAKKLGVETVVVDRKNFAAKTDFEKAMIHELESRGVHWIALAGFMRILSPDFVNHFHGRILNIHPSLLPAFPGGHSIKDAFDARVKETGVTVHFVDDGVDTGPIILQKKVAVEAKDTLESLETKVHAAEYEIYPEALRLVLSGKVHLPAHNRDEEFGKD